MGRLNIAVVGSGISGLSAAWLLSKHHTVTLIERSSRLGGHANTVDAKINNVSFSVDTGFIVYNEAAYPNFAALLTYLGVATVETEMTFSVSLNGGNYEYSGSGLHRLFGQWSNLASPAQWRLTLDIVRFFRNAPKQAAELHPEASLGEFLEHFGYSPTFINRHLLPMAGAVWSADPALMADYPVRAFVRFFSNHGLLTLSNRPRWRTVKGGSREYVQRLAKDAAFRALLNIDVKSIIRRPQGVVIAGPNYSENFDHVVIATHADQALSMLPDADEMERQDLQAFRYTINRAVLHTDELLMPLRRKLWSSWNYLGTEGESRGVATVTYWMNALQPLNTLQNVFVTLNPVAGPRPSSLIQSFEYEHPVYSRHAMQAQQRMWRLQGRRRTWFCGAHFGAGFHEDGLQSGLAVAEQLGGMERPWQVANASGRIHVISPTAPERTGMREAAE